MAGTIFTNTVIVGYRDLIVRNDNQDSEIQTISEKEEEHIRARSSNFVKDFWYWSVRLLMRWIWGEREMYLIELTTGKLDCSLSLEDVEDDGQFGWEEKVAEEWDILEQIDLQEVGEEAEVCGKENKGEIGVGGETLPMRGW